MKYVDHLKAKGSDAAKEKQLQHTADKAKLQMQADLLETESLLGSAKVELEELKSSSTLSAQKLSETEDKIESLEKGKARIEGYLTELF
jgi:septal ring factor EnvC (AmiA/AmiB activator)